MPVLHEHDFDKLATRVVDQFLSGKAKLAEAAAQEATEAGLNPDQIERLTQAANTMTFLRMMDNRKAQNAGDLMHEFDPIDSRQVIRIVIDNTGVHVDPGTHANAAHAPDEHELPDEMAAHRAPPAEATTCPAGLPSAEADEESPKEAALRVMRMQKLAGVLEDQYRQAEWTFEDTFSKLAERFKRIYNDVKFDEFEKDAMAEHGDSAGIQVLNLLRQERKLAPLGEGAFFTKVAALTDRHVSEETIELRLYETLVKVAHDADNLRRGLEWVRTRCA